MFEDDDWLNGPQQGGAQDPLVEQEYTRIASKYSDVRHLTLANVLANEFHRPATEKVSQTVNYPLFNRALTKLSLSPYHCLAESAHCAVERLLFSLSQRLLPSLHQPLFLPSTPFLILGKLF